MPRAIAPLFAAPAPLAPPARATRRPRCVCRAPAPTPYRPLTPPTPPTNPTPQTHPTPPTPPTLPMPPTYRAAPPPHLSERRCSAGGTPRLSRRAAVRLLCAAAVAAAMPPPARGSDSAPVPASGSASTEELDAARASDIDPATDEPEMTTRAYVELSVAGQSAGRVVIGLYGKLLPRTAANFEQLVRAGSYDGTPVYRIVPGLTVQLGDVLRNGGKSGAASAQSSDRDDAAFAPDSFRVSHTIPGIVSMVRRPDGRVDSRFFVATRPGDSMYLDGKFAAFGRVVEGMDVLRRVEREGGEGFVRKPVKVVSCGMLE